MYGYLDVGGIDGHLGDVLLLGDLCPQALHQLPALSQLLLQPNKDIGVKRGSLV